MTAMKKMLNKRKRTFVIILVAFLLLFAVKAYLMHGQGEGNNNPGNVPGLTK